MSREQLTEQQPEQDAGASVADAKGDIYGLPPHLYRQIKSLRYGDAEGLKQLLDLHHELSRQILGVASSQIGLSAVKQALAMREQNVVAKPPPAMSREEKEELLSDPSDAPRQAAPSAAAAGPSTAARPPGAVPVSQDQLSDVRNIAGDAFDPEPSTAARPPGGAVPVSQDQLSDVRNIAGDAFDPEPSTAVRPPPAAAATRPYGAVPVSQEQLTDVRNIAGNAFDPEAPAAPRGTKPAAASQESEPGWIRAALRYNDQHPELVAEFNELTQRSCIVDGQADPVMVSEWQRMHGLTADAKIGPMTVAAARKARTVAAAPAAKAPAQDARIDV
ncbi:MAG TPA: hypothetical protein VFK02_20085 [Kofleriaceae bacterium]|nr:hypothetical protein [Kofleriaceae bacterium]